LVASAHDGKDHAVTARRLALMSVCLMFSQVALSSVRPMTSYRLLELGETPAVIGWISALYAIAPLALAIPAGRIATRGFAAWLAVIGSVLFTAGCVGLAFGNSVVQLAAASVLLGAGNLGQMIAYQTLIAAESREADYDRDYGWYSAGASLGQLVGPLLGTLTFEHFGEGLRGTTAANLVGSAAGGLALVLSMLLLGAASRSAASAQAQSERPARLHETLRYPGAAVSMYVSLVILSTIDLMSVYLPVLDEERGWSASFVGLLLMVRAAFSLLARLILSVLADRTSRRAILISTVGLTAVLCAAIPAVGGSVAILVLMAILGLGVGVGQPVSLAWTVAAVPPRARGTAVATRLMGNRLGQVVLPAASSVFVVVGGAASAFWLLGALLASSAGAVVATK
jgi:MFS family permease